MHPHLIRYELVKRRIRSAEIAQRLGLAPATIHSVIYGYGKSRRVAREISRLTGIPVSRLWPGRYPELEAKERAA